MFKSDIFILSFSAILWDMHFLLRRSIPNNLAVFKVESPENFRLSMKILRKILCIPGKCGGKICECLMR